jgi:hypothetical protein
MLSHDPFRQELRAQIQRGIKRGAPHLVISSAALRRAVTEAPQPEQMQICGDVMREEMRAGDSIVNDHDGDGLTICYLLPSTI